jgi:hypothetical protein
MLSNNSSRSYKNLMAMVHSVLNTTQKDRTPIKVAGAIYVENQQNGSVEEFMGYIWVVPTPSPIVRIGQHEVPLEVFEDFCHSIELQYFTTISV